MQQLRRFALFAAMTFALAACSESSGIASGGPQLDASSEAAMTASIEAMTDGMNNSDKQRVGQALAAIMMLESFAMMGEDISEAEMNDRLMASVDGLTALELIEKAERLTEEMQAQ